MDYLPYRWTILYQGVDLAYYEIFPDIDGKGGISP